MKRACLFFALLLSLGACHVRSQSEATLKDDAAHPLTSGTWKGKTADGGACSLTIVSYSERRDPEVDEPGDREYSNLQKTLELHFDFQHDPAVVFVVKSHFNMMWDAYETNYLTGSHKLEEDRFEFVNVALDRKNHIASVDYQKDPSHAIMGVALGDKMVSCRFVNAR